MKLMACRQFSKKIGSRYPGHNCPGLIEAFSDSTLRSSLERRYPGHNCPGLIEATRSRFKVFRYRFVIRGITAPASLKREVQAPPGVAQAGYPGHNCPGLIEASPEKQGKRTSTCSGYPGHNCPGLIEAASPRE
ncbi:protein of unknown function [Candidatus Methylocalor cossyra]|uniref:Uncharacterized protein n=1 Tax=Candidatus Methylocalor cossyra TaxID=3108543 RepID=A0ABM9NH21_9GAMM